MRRREFIAMLGGAAAWPFPAAAQIAQPQPSTLPTIGFLNNLSPDLWHPAMSGFLRGLGEAGFVEGRNVAFTYRWTEGRKDRLPQLAADLAQANVAVIIASADTATALAALAATSKIPVVFATQDDPVRYGLVSSLDQPGGRATGMFLVKPVSDGSARQAVFRQLVPDNQIFYSMDILETSSFILQTEPDAAFENLLAPSSSPHFIKGTVRAVMIHSGPFLDIRRRSQLVSLAARHRLPALYDWRVFAEEGGLISYGISIEETYSRIGRYAGELLKGRTPAEMPILKPTKFETVVNLKTAAELGLKVPPELLAGADKVIE
jgi:putative tryptophan/tyrosine transport system substrate-binding protein